ncbi:MAG: hypothetical protein ACYSUQ_14255 [Planctomycetota bacterium]|jgi:hypothetical protein
MSIEFSMASGMAEKRDRSFCNPHIVGHEGIGAARLDSAPAIIAGTAR